MGKANTVTMASSVIPGLRYRDAPAAIEFLCNAFGFERHLVVPADGDRIAHAQLVLGRDMIMLGSHPGEGEYGQWVAPPASPDAVTTMGLYLVVDDCDAHCARARAAGARIVMEPRDEDYGGRDYTCRDPEGNVWTFGTYDPWTA
jgi:uncharacterized glyoxalase superfamily protein PhnB